MVKKRDFYFILVMVSVVAFLGYMSRIHRFKPIPANEYHKNLQAPDDCLQCHQHPSGWSLTSPPRPTPGDPALSTAMSMAVPAAHPNKPQCLRCHEGKRAR
ncbi:MAG: hypothetical protein HYR55_09795 [Acidobacteria bacterium]|nr:hypothetical protein [Acidobacteriota bacterium]MBI3657323.1 hypothetical protein [Acidobacteriota bacterium]